MAAEQNNSNELHHSTWPSSSTRCVEVLRFSTAPSVFRSTDLIDFPPSVLKEFFEIL